MHEQLPNGTRSLTILGRNIHLCHVLFRGSSKHSGEVVQLLAHLWNIDYHSQNMTTCTIVKTML